MQKENHEKNNSNVAPDTLLVKVLNISTIYNVLLWLARGNVNLKCSLLPTQQRKQTSFENKHVAVSTHLVTR